MIIIKLSECLEDNDKDLLRYLSIREVFIKLNTKYIDNSSAKNEKLVREFYNYKFTKNDIIKQA